MDILVLISILTSIVFFGGMGPILLLVVTNNIFTLEIRAEEYSKKNI